MTIEGLKALCKSNGRAVTDTNEGFDERRADLEAAQRYSSSRGCRGKRRYLKLNGGRCTLNTSNST